MKSFLKWTVVLILFLGTLTVKNAVDTAVASGDPTCPYESFRVGLSAALPDCRAYELVSPPYTQGYPVTGLYVGPSGESESRVLFTTYGSFANSKNSGQGARGAPYEAVRMPTGWAVQPLEPNASEFPVAITEDASSSLQQTLWVSHAQGESIDQTNYYLKETQGSLKLIGPLIPPAAVTGPVGNELSYNAALRVEGDSSELSHMTFGIRAELTNRDKRDPLWTGDTTMVQGVGNYSLYQYEYTGLEHKEPELVGVENEEQLEKPGKDHINEGAALISDCGTVLGAQLAGEGNTEIINSGTKHNAISANGNTIFFTALGKNSGYGECTSLKGPATSQIYARINRKETLPISQPLPTICIECIHLGEGFVEKESVFQGASETGDRAFFTTEAELFPGQSGMNLYEYSSTRPPGYQLALVSKALTGQAGVKHVERVSADGSHVYFIANGILTSSTNPTGAKPIEGANNLYAFDSNENRMLFVGTLTESDGGEWLGQDLERPIELTPNGDFALFSSHAHLTQDDKSGPEVSQLFEYDAIHNKLVRISRGQTVEGGELCKLTGQVEEGYNCNGNSLNEEESASFAGQPSYGSAVSYSEAHSKIALSSDGSYVVFLSRMGLTPQSANVNGQCANAYEYASTGENIEDGNVHLISSGRDTAPNRQECNARFKIEPVMSEAGKDVFFEAGDALVPADANTQLNLYDARINGGFPEHPEPMLCTGEGCQGPLNPAPAFGEPSSATLSGLGNVVTPAPSILTTVKPKVEQKTAARIRAEKLAKALKACKSKTKRSKRRSCEASSRKRYGAKSKAKKVSRRNKP